MNGLVRALIGIGIGYVVLKILTIRPVKTVLLTALVDGAYILIKKRLKS